MKQFKFSHLASREVMIPIIVGLILLPIVYFIYPNQSTVKDIHNFQIHEELMKSLTLELNTQPKISSQEKAKKVFCPTGCWRLDFLV